MYSLTIRKLQLSWYRPKKIQLHKIPKHSHKHFLTRMATGMLSQESVIVPSLLLRRVSKDLFQSHVKQELSS